MRCLSLGEAIRLRGGEVEFVTQRSAGNLAATISKNGFRVHGLAARNRTERTDALDTLQRVGACDFFIVDHYSLGSTWETTVGKFGSRIVAIDDLANRTHTASLVVDSTYPGDQRRYHGLTNGRVLLGTRFALLSAAFKERRRSPATAKPSTVPTVLVYFGASDLPGLTLKALEALTDANFRKLTVDVVTGRNTPHSRAIQQMSRSQSRWHIHEPQPSLAPLLAQADYAITGGGVTLLERACLGVPGLTVTLADNQVPSVSGLASAGVTHHVGSSGDVTPAMIRDELTTLTANTINYQAMSQAGMMAVDGLGAQRVAEVLLPTARDRLTLRPASSQDVYLYFEWANESEVRAMSLTNDRIAWEPHVAWFTNMITNPSSHLYVLEASGLPIAQARFEQRKDFLSLAYSVDALFRGRGLGIEVVKRAIASLPDEAPRKILATVKVSNQGSRATLTRAGFVPDDMEEIASDQIQLRRMR